MAALGAPTLRLAELLQALFDGGEVHRFLYGYEIGQIQHGKDLLDSILPHESTEPGQYFLKVAEKLQQRGLVDALFFERLRRERPGRAEHIAHLEQRWRTEAEQLKARRASLWKLCRAFFVAAGVELEEEAEHLRIPELVWQSPQAPTVAGVEQLERVLSRGERSFFVYPGELPADVREQLDRLRARGNPTAPLEVEAMQAALEDGCCGALLLQRRKTYFDRQNLFTMKNAITDQRFFFGREQLLTQIGSWLSSGEHVLITGLRKVGKTSVLRMLRYHLSEHPWCAVDLQSYRSVSEGKWLPDVFTRIVRAFDAWGRQRFSDWPQEPPNEQISDGLTLSAALSLRRSWQEQRGRREPLILVLDELEWIFPSPQQPNRVTAYTAFAGALRALGQAGGDRSLALVGADLRPTVDRQNRLAGRTSNPFYRFFHVLPLPLMTRTEVAEMTRSIGRLLGLDDIRDGFIDALFAFSGGHPSLSRMIAGAAYEQRRVSTRLSEEDFATALEVLGDDWEIESFFEESLWKQMTPAERREVLLVRDQPHHGSHRSKAMASLRRQGIVTRQGIPIGGFAEWLEAVDGEELASK
ncbi:MAG: ATP-binding protein [Myxococcota bacterium]